VFGNRNCWELAGLQQVLLYIQHMHLIHREEYHRPSSSCLPTGLAVVIFIEHFRYTEAIVVQHWNIVQVFIQMLMM